MPRRGAGFGAAAGDRATRRAWHGATGASDAVAPVGTGRQSRCGADVNDGDFAEVVGPAAQLVPGIYVDHVQATGQS